MHQFDTYIKSIVKDLNISRTLREEISDEFRDHLEMLAKDYIDQGNTEEAAAVMAIEKFGNSNLLGKKLSVSLNNFRSIPNILFGICYLAFLLLICKVLGPMLIKDFTVSGEMSLSQFCFKSLLQLSLGIVLLIPIGYFVPIIFKTMNRLKYIIGIYGLLVCLDIVYGAYLSYKYSILGGSIHYFIALSVMSLMASMVSGVLGYKLLSLVNNKLFTARKMISKGF